MLVWQVRNKTVALATRPLVMGIVNVTPDSFSDGGRFHQTEVAVAHGLRLVDEGADILDIGGESTRPGAAPVLLHEELRRVVPVVAQLAKQTSVLLSIDTSKAEVARQCLEAGVHVINDVTALTGDSLMAGVAQSYRAGVVLMHMQGSPATMQDDPRYDDVVSDIIAYLEAQLHRLSQLGIAGEQAVVDPGIGFGKTLQHNLTILARLQEMQKLGRPVCLGVSRKGLLGRVADKPVDRRLPASLAAAAWAACHQAANILRVHDVEETVDAVKVIEAIANCR